MGNYESDNLIDYSVGPCDISISPWEDRIWITIYNPAYEAFLQEVLEVAKEAWELDESQIISINKGRLPQIKAEIKLNYITTKLYLSHAIILF